MEGHTQGHIKRNNETFYFVCPKSAIFVPDTQKYPSSRLIHLRYVTKNSLKNKEKTLDYIGRYQRLSKGQTKKTREAAGRSTGLLTAYSASGIPLPRLTAAPLNSGAEEMYLKRKYSLPWTATPKRPLRISAGSIWIFSPVWERLLSPMTTREAGGDSIPPENAPSTSPSLPRMTATCFWETVSGQTSGSIWRACRVFKNMPACSRTVQSGTACLPNPTLSPAWKPSSGTL